MKRFIMEELIKWKNKDNRKPLILKGARQVGKTYILKEFGATYYNNVAYFNFDHDEDLKNLFVHTKDPKRILEQLSLVNKKAIMPKMTLIIFDEIQECPNALNALKYFNEEANDYHIVAAGSLLGLKLSYTSFPVGKVEFMSLLPMSFSEFLIADECENLVDYMKSIKVIENIPDIFFSRLEEKLRVYFMIGGMPEAVLSWIQNKDIEKVDKILSTILESYEQDFSKHVSKNEAIKINIIWNSIPSQLAKDNKKFVYDVAKEGARAREYENAIMWLVNANLLYKINNIKKIGLPISTYEDLKSFKIYLNDIGLLRRHAKLDTDIIKNGDDLYTEFKGSLTENFVLTHLIKDLKEMPYYFLFDNFEIDFIKQFKNSIIPIEVKSGTSIKNASLTKFGQKLDTDIMVRFSMNNLIKSDKIINIPLFMVEYLDQILNLVK